MVLTVLAVLSGCHPTKRVADGDQLLKKQKVKINGDYDEANFTADDLNGILKQKLNRKILLVRFHLWAYNRVNPEQKELGHIRKQARIEKKIDRKQEKMLAAKAKGKDRKAKRLDKKIDELVKEEPLTWRDWLTETVGEAPVIHDSLLTEKSASQMSIFLSKHGYFDNSVDFEVGVSRNGKKATVCYDVHPGQVYSVRKLEYEVNDPGIARRIDFLKSTSTLDSGQFFSVDAFDDERQRISDYLTNRGYFGFNKEFIRFKADSTIGNHQVDITLEFLNPQLVGEIQDTTAVIYHPRYYIGDIFIDTSYDLRDPDNTPTDTLEFEGLKILYRGDLLIKPSLIAYTVYMDPGDLYQKDKAQKTYRRFNNLELFRSVSVQFEPQVDSDVNLLDCYIRLTPLKKQFFSTQTRGTHSDGNLGVEANLNYTHRNVFHGAEQGNFSITSGFEAAQTLTQTSQEGDVPVDGGGVTQGLRLNTFEIGPELSLTYHNIFLLDLDRFSRNSTPSSTLSLAYNYQSRPDYVRSLTEFRYDGKWVENLSKGRTYFFHLPELSVIKIEKSQSFQDLLDNINDDFLTNSYQDHLIISVLGLGAIFSNQQLKHQRKRHYFNFNIEGAGVIPRALMKTFNAPTNDDGSYSIAGIQYAHYTRAEIDYRRYWNYDEKNTVATRLGAGVGKPWENLGALPFEKSFFSGGANSVRAWQARSLGPGSFRDTTALVTYNNIGEVKLEGNIEYRFNVTPTFEGAIFIDAGNVWLLNPSAARPGAAWGRDFYSEIAVGGGLGFRLDMDFFLIRLDLGMQLKDPAKIQGERWIWEPKDEYNEFVKGFYPEGGAPEYFPVVNFNLGIGYPF